MKQYKALLFDFDDTLFDFGKSEAIALKKTFERFRIPMTKEHYDIYEAQNLSFWRAFEKGVYKNEADSVVRFVNFCAAIGREDIDTSEMCQYYIDRLSETAFPIEDSVTLLKKLSKHYDVYIVTNALKKVNQRRCEVGGILPFVKDVFISETIGISKPQKGFFDYCFAHISAAPAEALLIGDSLASDIKGGVDYGIDTCWFNRFLKENKEGLTITFEISSLRQLEEILL